MITSPVSWIIEKISTTLIDVTVSASEKITTVITPIMASLFGVYIILMVLNYWRGAESSPVVDFIMRIVKFSVVIGVGLNQSNYANTIIPIVTGLGQDLATIIPNVDGISDMDKLLNFYGTIIEKSITETMHLDTALKFLMVLLKTAIILIGLMPFLIAATLTLVIAEAGPFLLAMVGPLFFAAALFPATRQFFSSWVSSVVSYALLPLMVSAVSLIAVGVSKEALSDQGSLTKATLGSIIAASLINWVLLFMIIEARNLASSLSAGGISSATGAAVGEKVAGGLKSAGKSAAGSAGKAAGKAGKALYNKLNPNSVKKAG